MHLNMGKIVKTSPLIIASILFVQCANTSAIVYKEDIKNEDDDSFKCENADIIAVLKDEPAYIKEDCYRVFGKKYSFMIVLKNHPNVEYHFSTTIYPYKGIPEEFQEDNLPVLISGNLLDCRSIVACEISPNARYAAFNLFELTAIKTAAK